MPKHGSVRRYHVSIWTFHSVYLDISEKSIIIYLHELIVICGYDEDISDICKCVSRKFKGIFIFIQNRTVFDRLTCLKIRYDSLNRCIFNGISDLIGIGMPEHLTIRRNHVCVRTCHILDCNVLKYRIELGCRKSCSSRKIHSLGCFFRKILCIGLVNRLSELSGKIDRDCGFLSQIHCISAVSLLSKLRSEVNSYCRFFSKILCIVEICAFHCTRCPVWGNEYLHTYHNKHDNADCHCNLRAHLVNKRKFTLAP